MTDWQPLSQRHRGESAYDDGPYEGLPPHLRTAVLAWIQRALFDSQSKTWRVELVEKLALRFRLEYFPHGSPGQTVAKHFLEEISGDEDLMLDVVDGILANARAVKGAFLRDLLRDGGSAWTVAENERGLERAVDPTAAAAAVAAMAPRDEASADLRIAWSHTYGRSPDPSDAWDHAIKAVESLLYPLVSPANAKATLGSMIATMRQKPGKWEHVLPADRSDGVELLIELLDMMWPNPDRHATGATRPPTPAEAQAAVQIAVLVVSWLRDSAITQVVAP